MKQCSYCGTKADDKATVCASCGASSFSNVCPNCGKAFDHGSFCPVCGTNADALPKICPKCGYKYFTNACPNCGYTAASATQQQTQQSGYSRPQSGSYTQPAQNTQSKFGCGKLILWILFFPIMLLITVWKSKSMGTLVKVLLTVLILGVCCIIAGSSKKKNAGTGATAKPAVTATAAPSATASPTGTAVPGPVI